MSFINGYLFQAAGCECGNLQPCCNGLVRIFDAEPSVSADGKVVTGDHIAMAVSNSVGYWSASLEQGQAEVWIASRCSQKCPWQVEHRGGAEAQTKTVYTCETVVDGMVHWSYWDDPDDGGNGVDTFALSALENQPMANAFYIGGGGMAHKNGAPNNSGCEPESTRNMLQSPGFVGQGSDPGISNQMRAMGWAVVPDGETWTPAIAGVGQAMQSAYYGPAPGETDAEYIDIYTGELPGGSAALQPIALDERYERVADGVLVYYKLYSLNNQNFGGIRVSEVGADGAVSDVPLSRLSCTKPIDRASGREESADYELQEGETLAACGPTES